MTCIEQCHQLIIRRSRLVNELRANFARHETDFPLNKLTARFWNCFACPFRSGTALRTGADLEPLAKRRRIAFVPTHCYRISCG